jgi:hypothetical protein
MTKSAAPRPTWSQTSLKTMIPMTSSAKNPTAIAVHLSTKLVTARRVYGVALPGRNCARQDGLRVQRAPVKPAGYADRGLDASQRK